MLILQPLLKTTTTTAAATTITVTTITAATTTTTTTTTDGIATTSLLFLQCGFEEKLDPILVPEDTPSNTQRDSVSQTHTLLNTPKGR